MPAKKQLPTLTENKLLPSLPKNYSKTPEHRFNEKYLDYCKRHYCQKYNLSPANVYEKAFDYLNQRILKQVETEAEETQKDRKPAGHNFQSTKNYGRAFKIGSQKLLQLIKTQKANTQSSDLNTGRYFKEIRGLLVNKQQMTNNSQKKRKKAFPKVYDFDEANKFKIECQRKAELLEGKSAMLGQKIDRNIREIVLDPFSALPSEPFYANVPFTKNSYLASLNYKNTNPIIY